MDKNIIITGTSSGIGYELVKIFSTKGHNIIALSRNILPTNDLKLSNVYSISFDINNNSDHKVLIEYISKNWKHVDILINNAGVLINKPFSETTTEDFNKVYSTNVFGVAAIINNILPFAKKGCGNGSIFNTNMYSLLISYDIVVRTRNSIKIILGICLGLMIAN